jgi:phospholipase/carboxylesterase
MNDSQPVHSPHQDQPVLIAGTPLDQAHAAMIMIHGRGASATDILQFVDELAQDGFAYLAPQAAGNTWYPERFLAPLSHNEPWLSSGLALIDTLCSRIATAGIPYERMMLLGFSQGACLTLEFAARHARRYGGIVGWSGGLIGPADLKREYHGSLAGTPIFLGCSDIDPHVPQDSVDMSAEILQQLGGEVTKRIYENMGHTVNLDEVTFVQQMMESLGKE